MLQVVSGSVYWLASCVSLSVTLLWSCEAKRGLLLNLQGLVCFLETNGVFKAQPLALENTLKIFQLKRVLLGPPMRHWQVPKRTIWHKTFNTVMFLLKTTCKQYRVETLDWITRWPSFGSNNLNQMFPVVADQTCTTVKEFWNVPLYKTFSSAIFFACPVWSAELSSS